MATRGYGLPTRDDVRDDDEAGAGWDWRTCAGWRRDRASCSASRPAATPCGCKSARPRGLMVFTPPLTLDRRTVRAPNPARCSYKLLHPSVQTVRCAGQRIEEHMQYDWSWPNQLASAFHRLRNLPLRAT